MEFSLTRILQSMKVPGHIHQIIFVVLFKVVTKFLGIPREINACMVFVSAFVKMETS